MNPTPKENQHTSTSQFDEKAKTEARSLQDIIINSVAIGSIYLIFGYIISLSLGLGTRVILSRTLGAETYGYFAIILAISTVTYLFIIFALDFSLLRYIPSKIDKPQEVTKTIYSVILVLIIPSLIFTSLIILLREWLATIFLGNPLLAFSIGIGAFLAPFFAYYTLVYSIFQGFQDMKSVMIINIIQAVILVNLTILFLWLGFGLIGAIFSFLGAGISAVFFGLYRLRRKHLVSIPKWQLHIPKSLLLLGLLVYVIQFFDV
ncbi:MAG: oligosaccharide flippase family protein, partial [Candidatus Odinarchaeota archaeon]